jgi:hypothetical protein
VTKRKVLITVVALVFVYLFATLLRAERLLFDKRVGYIYHSGTDELFEVLIRPSVLNKSEVWNPLAPVLYHEIVSVEPLGQFATILAELEVNRRLRTADPEAWQQKLKSQTQLFIAETQRQLGEGFEFTDITFYPRSGLTTERVLPRELQALAVYAKGDVPGLITGDAIVVRWRKEAPVEERVLNGAVFIRNQDAVQQITRTIGRDEAPL